MRSARDMQESTEASTLQESDPVLPDRLGWRVVDVLKESLPERVLTPSYVHLGCRHYLRAIAAALHAAVVSGTAIPNALAAEIADWLDAYDGHPDQQRITQLLSRAKRQER